MFKVMTWNVENLFRPGTDFGPSSREVYEQKLLNLATTIDDAAPDAIALQEVGDPLALGDLAQRLRGRWHQRVARRADRRGIRVAWLSPRRIEASEETIRFLPGLQPVQADDAGTTATDMGRGALAVTLELAPGKSVRLLVAHLKSKLLTFAGGRFFPRDEDERVRAAAYALYRRAAEAATLRAWASAALADDGLNRAVVVTGDLNDTEQAATTQMLLGPPGSEIGTAGFRAPDRGDAQRLWNLASSMPAGRDYSRVNNGRKELIDHILVSAALVRRLDGVEALVEDELPSVTGDPRPRLDAPASDHAPVVATFDV